MREIQVAPLDEGQRLDKYLFRSFKEAEKSFLYRMLRKKNITLNGKKAEGSERLRAGDAIQVFFSEETFVKMQGRTEQAAPASGQKIGATAAAPLSVVFENEHILIVNKPAGLLTQKAAAGDDCLTDRILSYCLARSGPVSLGFSPAAANRLDRNTSGLVLAGKTLPGQQLLAFWLQGRMVEKYYAAVVKGPLGEEIDSALYWMKDAEKNQVFISEEGGEGAVPIALKARSLQHLDQGCDLLRVQLISGKSHQVRAQLAHLGHPIVGDGKYGDGAFQRRLAAYVGFPLRVQLLHSREVVFPAFRQEDSLSDTALALWKEVAGRRFVAPYPAYFRRVLTALGGQYGE